MTSGAVSLLAREAVLAAFLVFCRVGGALMLMPGIGGRHIPMRVRVFLALALSFAFLPLVLDQVAPKVRTAGSGDFVFMIAGELLTGLLIGLLARLYVTALQFATSFVAQAVGVSPMPGASVEEDEQLPILVTLIVFSATALIFVADLHLELVKGLVDSFARVPPGSLLAVRPALVDLVDQMSAVFLVAVRLCGPFILYSVMVNFAVGLINKFTPQIPVYFVATPFVTAGGLLLLYVSVEPLLSAFLVAFSQWLRAG